MGPGWLLLMTHEELGGVVNLMSIKTRHSRENMSEKKRAQSVRGGGLARALPGPSLCPFLPVKQSSLLAPPHTTHLRPRDSPRALLA
jgi:hypothetical protein